MNEQRFESGPAILNWKVAGIVAIFAAGLVIAGVLRFYDVHAEDPPALAAYATALYISLTIFAAVLSTRVGVPLKRLGFGPAFRPGRYLLLALFGVALIRLIGWLLDPAWESVFGAGRDLERFSGIAGSPAALIQLLALNWTVAAFGEELAFRIVLMRGIAFALGDTRMAFGVALIVQAVVFGLVHAYQGPAGIAGTTINGLVFGGLTLAARGSIWPAAMAHGLGNTLGIVEVYLAG